MRDRNGIFDIVTKPNINIAVVDDEEPIRRALLRLMRSVGIQAHAFASCAEFLKSLEAAQPDCVILDLHMPQATGFDVQTRLQRDWPHIAVIVVTGHHSTEAQARAMLCAPVAYLHKPMNDQALLDSIALAMQRRAAAGQ